MAEQSGAAADKSEIRQETAGHLANLYTVGAGLGIVIAMERLFDGEPADPVLVWEAVPAALAFLATLMPFFHGSMRHMHSAWGAQANPSARVMMFDFVVLFSQTILFFVMAEFLRNPTKAGLTLWVLLILDVVWLFARERIDGKAPATAPEGMPNWAKVNLLFLILIPAVLFLAPESLPAVGLGSAIAVLATVRTVLDYAFNKEFYFG